MNESRSQENTKRSIGAKAFGVYDPKTEEFSDFAINGPR
jgi:hypothetical protein